MHGTTKLLEGGKVVEGLYYGQVEGRFDTYSLLDHTPPIMIIQNFAGYSSKVREG